MDRFVTRVPTASRCSTGSSYSHASSSNSSSSSPSCLRSSPPESINSPTGSTVQETADCIIVDSPPNNSEAEDSDICQGSNGKPFTKNGRRAITRKDLPFGYKPSFLRRRRARKSYVWAYGYPVKNRSGRDCWACEQCLFQKAQHNFIFAASGTSHIIEHLRRHHRIGRNGANLTTENPSASSASPASSSMPTMSYNLVTPVDLDEARKLFTEFIIMEGITRRQSTSPQLQRLIKLLNPTADGICPDSHGTSREWIKARYIEACEAVAELMRNAIGRIHISFDAWSSRSNLCILSVVAHFVDQLGHLWALPIGLPEIYGSKTGENMAALLSGVFERYDITHKLGFLIADNATTNDRVIDLLSTRCGWDAEQRRIRCSGHILNLVAKAIVFGDGISLFEKRLASMNEEDQYTEWRKKSSIGKVHNIVRWLRGSPERMQAFKELQKFCPSLKLKPDELFKAYSLPSDGGVRWNSTFLQVDTILPLRNAIDITCSRHAALSRDRLTGDDWAELEQFHSLLLPLWEMTKRIEGNASDGSHGALWEVLPMMDYILEHLESTAKELQYKPDSYFKTAVDFGHLKMRSYYSRTDLTPAYRAAVVLHPALKFEYFEEKWAENKAWIEDCKTTVKAYWVDYMQQRRIAAVAEEQAATSKSTPQLTTPEDSEEEKLSPFGRFLQLAGAKERKLEDEFERYCALKPDVEVRNPIKWWFDHREEYPNLCVLALELHSCPGMSSECERIFSDTGRMVTPDRNRFSAASLEEEECLRKWLRMGVPGA